MINFVKQNQEWVEKAQIVFDLQQQRKLLQEKEEMALLELKELTGDVNSYGGGFKYEVGLRIGSVDYKSIPQLKGVNVDMYRKPNTNTYKLIYVGKITDNTE